MDGDIMPIVFLKGGHSGFGKMLTPYWHYIHEYTNDFRQDVALGSWQHYIHTNKKCSKNRPRLYKIVNWLHEQGRNQML